LGFESLLEIAKLNPKKIILACRNIKRGEKALNYAKNNLNVNNI